MLTLVVLGILFDIIYINKDYITLFSYIFDNRLNIIFIFN